MSGRWARNRGRISDKVKDENWRVELELLMVRAAGMTDKVAASKEGI